MGPADTKTPLLGIDCEHLEPQEVDDLRAFLLASNPDLKIEKPFRARAYDSAEYHAFSPVTMILSSSSSEPQE